MVLVGAGVASAGVYLVLTLRLPVWRYGWRLYSWSQILGKEPGPVLQLLTGLAVLFVSYLVGWRAIHGWRAAPNALPPPWLRFVIWGGATLYAMILIWLLPVTSDLFTYLSQAHAITDLGANPLLHAPLDWRLDQLVLAYPTYYLTRASVYGPAWLLLSAPGTLGPHDLAAGLPYLKGLAAVAYLGCAWLLERLLADLRPAEALEGFYLFAWNPLILLMAVGDGHNDIVMMGLVLLALWLLRCERWGLALGTLAISVWLKYVSLIFVVPFLIYAWRRLSPARRGPALGRGALAAFAVSVLVFLPFTLLGTSEDTPIPWIEGIIRRLFLPVNSQVGAQGELGAVLAAGVLLFAVCYGVLVWRFARASGWQRSQVPRPLFLRLADLCFLLALLLFVLGAARSQPWHLIWPVALAGLSARRWAWPVMVGLSALMLGVQIWVEWGAPGWDLVLSGGSP